MITLSTGATQIKLMNRIRHQHGGLLLILCLLVFLQGCVYGMLDLAVPNDGYSEIISARYGDHPRQQLDLYLPEQERADVPTLVFFYGGSWAGGSKDNYRFIGQAFAAAGYRVAIPDYRVYPEHLFPDFIVDGADSLAWLEREGFADRGMVLMGHSAGAHIAAMLAYNPAYVEASGLDHKLIMALIGYAGPYDDFALSSRKLKRIFAPAEPLAVSRPINFVDQNSPVSLLIHGLSDSTVVVKHSQNLADKLRAHGVTAKTCFYQDNGHVAVVASLALPLRHWTPAFADTLDFLAELSSKPSLGNSAASDPPPRNGTICKQPQEANDYATKPTDYPHHDLIVFRST
jgi:acetyl esterase/lipase